MKPKKCRTRKKEINTRDERTGSQQTVSKQMLERVQLLQQEKKQENDTPNTQAVRERKPNETNVFLSMCG